MRTPARYLVGLLLVALLSAGGVALLHAGIYGWTVFVLLPSLVGGLASWVFCPTTRTRAAGLGALTVVTATFFLLILGLEGSVCILMSLPIVVLLGAFGGWLMFHAGHSSLATPGASMLLLLPAATLTWDVKAPPPVFKVRTEIAVAATPEQVWKHVVTFPELPEPQEWYFRTGIAYPRRARIEGSGPGAIRYCEFSTGAFVEPIEVWDEPRLMRFSVTENPAPMKEMGLYTQVFPKHLKGYLISKRGQFRLTQLKNGHTLLEGTTWYQHGLWPAEYWRWWSDAIIHRIHSRVLDHIRILAEQGACARAETEAHHTRR